MELISVKNYDPNRPDVIELEMGNPKFAVVHSNHPAGYEPTYHFMDVEGSKEKKRMTLVQLMRVSPYKFDAVIQVFGF